MDRVGREPRVNLSLTVQDTVLSENRLWVAETDISDHRVGDGVGQRERESTELLLTEAFLWPPASGRWEAPAGHAGLRSVLVGAPEGWLDH